MRPLHRLQRLHQESPGTRPGSYWAQVSRLAEVQDYFGPAGKASAECLTRGKKLSPNLLTSFGRSEARDQTCSNLHGLLSLLDALDLKELYMDCSKPTLRTSQCAYIYIYIYSGGTCHVDLRNRVYEDMHTCHTLQRCELHCNAFKCAHAAGRHGPTFLGQPGPSSPWHLVTLQDQELDARISL